MIRIPALSLWRPWPGLILRHGKNIENRGWSTQYRGPMWIHAAKPWSDLDAEWLLERGIDPGQVEPWTPEHPKGIVGLVDVVGVCNTWSSSLSYSKDCECGPWAMPDQFHWQLADPRPLPEPVPCPGRPGLWYPVGEVAKALVALAEVMVNA
jgi:hypothetical protein